jgi:hypothetical protein
VVKGVIKKCLAVGLKGNITKEGFCPDFVRNLLNG